jgi:LPS-assembly lipoprotein
MSARRFLPLPLGGGVWGRGASARSCGATLAPTPPPAPLPQGEGENVIPRRGFLALGSAVVLAGCGIQPVYMPTASGQAGPAARELAAIHVNLMPDRPGQLMRQALQDRLEGAGGVVPQRYDLAVSFWIGGSGIGEQHDTTITRTRLIGYVNWTLTAQDLGHTKITSGGGHATDAENSLDTQIFASDLEIEVIEKRLAEALADQVTLQLAAFFRKRASVVAAD